MALRLMLPKRLPITATFAARPTPAFVRFNSTSSTSPAAQVVQKASEIARAAEKPSPLEAAVPVMWALTGALAFAAFNRAGQKEDHVEKLLIV